MTSKHSVAVPADKQPRSQRYAKLGTGVVSRWLLGAFFIVAGVMHFIFPQAYQRIMPSWLGWHATLVFISGVAECAGGIGILWAKTRVYAGWGLLMLCVAVLPANVQMLTDAIAKGQPIWVIVLLVLRLPLQILLMRWIWQVAGLSRKNSRQLS